MPNPDIPPLDFEKPVAAIQDKIEELKTLSQQTGIDVSQEIDHLQQQADDFKERLYQNLTPSQRIQIARHAMRPNFTDFVTMLSPDVWIELHGDRAGADDRAVIGGIIQIGNQPVMIVGTQKGKSMKENIVHNFGMANPEGYRKAMRLFSHAEKFNMPVVTLIDTPGAYPGIHSEEFGIGQAIAWNIREMSRLRVPIISIVTGEGCSGGALGIGVADRIYMLEHSLYTVISPEGCASILWRSAEHAPKAAEALKITAQDLLSFGMIDGIIPEPMAGAHHDPAQTAHAMLETIEQAITELKALSVDELREQRYGKFRSIGVFEQAAV
jgi:acetyl-CoA carboxylase carboxyl transferase subunit alpha